MSKAMRISGLVTAVLLVCLTAFLFSCQSGSSGETTTTTNNNTPASTAADYKVTVVDYKGNAVNDVIVNILQNGSNKGMKVLSNGEAVFSLEKGDYTVELTFTGAGSSYSYDKAECTLSAEKTSATIHVYNKPSASESIYARTDMEQEHKEYKAQIITEGGSLVELSASDRNFFLFVPSQGGQFTVQGPLIVESVKAIEGADLALCLNAFVYGDECTNLLQPLYVIPALAVVGMKLKDVWGFMAFICMFWFVITCLGLYFIPMFI